jgi:hypothetical protein
VGFEANILIEEIIGLLPLELDGLDAADKQGYALKLAYGY